MINSILTVVLIFQEYLYKESQEALKYILKTTKYEGVYILGTYFKLNDALFNYTPHNNNNTLKRNCHNICIDNNINFNIITKNANFGKAD